MDDILDFQLGFDKRYNKIDMVSFAGYPLIFGYKKKDKCRFVSDNLKVIKLFIKLLDTLGIDHGTYEKCNNINKDNKKELYYYDDKYYSVEITEKACNSLIGYYKVIGKELVE